MKICKKCGTEIAETESALFCPECGMRIEKEEYAVAAVVETGKETRGVSEGAAVLEAGRAEVNRKQERSRAKNRQRQRKVQGKPAMKLALVAAVVGIVGFLVCYRGYQLLDENLEKLSSWDEEYDIAYAPEIDRFVYESGEFYGLYGLMDRNGQVVRLTERSIC